MPRKKKSGRGKNGIPWYRETHGFWIEPRTKRALLDKHGQKIRGRENERAALDAWREMHGRDLATEQGLDNPVGTILNLYLEVVQGRVRTATTPKTYKHYFKLFLAHCKSTGVERVRDLKPAVVRRWLDGRTTWNQSTRKHAGNVLVAAFQWATQAEDGRYITHNPLAGLKLKPMLKRTRDVVITDEQFRAGVALARHQQIKDVMTVLWESGTRPINLCRVTVADVHPSCKWATLYEHKTAAKGERPLLVFFPDEAGDIVRRLIQGKQPGDNVFTTLKGRAWQPKAIADLVGRIAEKMGLKGRFIPYSCRHGLATRMLENGIGMTDAAGITGHTAKTMDINYSHVGEHPERLVELLEAMNARTRGPAAAPTAPASDRRGRAACFRRPASSGSPPTPRRRPAGTASPSR